MIIDRVSAVGQHSWVLGQHGPEPDHRPGEPRWNYLADVVEHITGEHYTRDFPTVDIFAPRLSFPSVNTGAGGDGGTLSDRQVYQISDDVSLLKGNHAMKFGANFNYLLPPGHPERERAFRDAHLLRRSVRDRQQQQRPVSAGLSDPGHRPESWQQANGGAVNGQGYWAGHAQQRAAVRARGSRTTGARGRS